MCRFDQEISLLPNFCPYTSKEEEEEEKKAEREREKELPVLFILLQKM